MAADLWRRYFLPSVTFMSVVVGGGYATGRELVEFFFPAGPAGGLLGMAVTAIVWSVVFALSLELARATRCFDYRSFFRALLGRAWVLFEIVYLLLLLLVLAVLGAACGEIAEDLLSAPAWTGTAFFIALLALFSWLGTAAIETFFSMWGLVLYVAYVVFIAIYASLFGDRIDSVLSPAGIEGWGWLGGGLAYAGYNIAVVPALLSCARHHGNRRETLIAGALAGPVAMLPGALLFFALLARYPEIAAAPVPIQLLLRDLSLSWLTIGMQVAIFGTLVQTGVGVLHGLNERLLGAYRPADAATSRRLRLLVSAGVSLLAIVLATRIGLIDLIAKGYGGLAWVILGIYAVPLLTVGAWRLFGPRREPREAEPGLGVTRA